MLFLAGLLFVLLQSASPITHTDTFTDVMAAGVTQDLNQVIDLGCNQPMTHTVQFVWRYTDDEVLDPVEVEASLHVIAEQVNYLFWRDSDAPDRALVPSWKLTPDCKLDIAYIGPEDRVPEIVRTKQILIERSVMHCGKAITFVDDRPTSDNYANLSSLAWVSRHCLFPYVVAHEFLHSAGAVQIAAPNSNGGYHSVDFGDIMATNRQPTICALADTIDCGNNDYFSLNPEPGSYLDTHWNSANSVYLSPIPRYSIILNLMFLGGSPQ